MTQSTAVNDPWAAAAVSGGAGSAPAAGPKQGSSIPAATQQALDPNADPFATPDSVMGGGGVRGPAWPDLLDRLVVLEPVEKLLDRPMPGQPNQTQDFYSVNLTVLDGGTLTVITPELPAQGDKPALPEQRNDYETPVTFPKWWAFGKGITVKLDNLKLPLMLGVVKRCPTGPGYRKGETWQDATKAWNEFVERLRADPSRAPAKPQFSWGLIDPTDEQRAAALDWYRSKQA